MKNILVASASVLGTVFILVFLAAGIDSIGSDFSDIRITALIAGVATLIALVALAIWAIPLHLLLSRIGKTKLIWYLLPSLLPGFIFVYWFKPFGRDLDLHLLSQAAFCSFIGAAAGMVFWYFAVVKPQRTSSVRE